MGKEVTYYNFAENDYWFLKANVEEKRVSNAMCASAQNTCERYLKEVILDKANQLGDTDIMKTHSLKKIRKFIEMNLPDFKCDWKAVVLADGYYFSARYPGDDSYFVDESDVETCWNAVQETKRATDRYLEQKQIQCMNEIGKIDIEKHRDNLRKRMGR